MSHDPASHPGRAVVESLARGTTTTSITSHVTSLTAMSWMRMPLARLPSLRNSELFQGFMATRISTPASRAYLTKHNKKEKLQKHGKALIYEHTSGEERKLLDAARMKEWDTYLKFGAAKVITKSEAEEFEFMKAGDIEELPMQW
eukprot:4151258-Amphidinium_carterae.1